MEIDPEQQSEFAPTLEKVKLCQIFGLFFITLELGFYDDLIPITKELGEQIKNITQKDKEYSASDSSYQYQMYLKKALLLK